MKKTNINRRVYHILTEALRESCDGKHMSIYSVSGDDGDSPLVFGVNWSAMGTQSTDFTKEFASNLVQATKIAQSLNELNLTLDWLEDVKLKDDKKDEWKEWLPKFYKVVELADVDLIEAGIHTMYAKFFRYCG